MGISGIKSMTFGLSHQGEFIPIAKVSQFSNSIDLHEMIDFIKENTIERFGPVRTLKPSLVYELYFDSINSSNRRKSGLVLSNVTIQRKIVNNPTITDSLDYLKTLI
ncbi:MAG: ATP-dependent DNA ligase, partial [Cyclobacteriaceae bacterium]|nr:ATP-dependent DNA ligase [Cyclobacteriaceae bacterium]